METLQWTLLVGLLGMVVYVLWARLRSFLRTRRGTKWKGDWEGEAVVVTGTSWVKFGSKPQGTFPCQRGCLGRSSGAGA